MGGSMDRKRFIRSLIGILAILAIVFFYTMRLVKIQLIDGELYYAKGKSSTVRKVDAPAARGEILDRNGVPLVVNRMGYSVVFDAAFFPSSREQDLRNEAVLKLIGIMEEEQEHWKDPLPLTFDGSGGIAFADGREGDVEKLKSFLSLNSYATAENCLDALREKYRLSDHSAEEARAIASTYYGMSLADFSVSLPYTFAEDISERTVSRVKENGSLLPGISVEVTSYREYTDGTLAPHVLGMTGAISPEEYEKRKEQGYLLNDTMGIGGIEYVMEDYLRGQRGERTVTTDYNGVTTSEYSKTPVQGDTVLLTLDAGLQQVTQSALQKTVDRLRLANEKDSSRYGPSKAGAVCVIDVRTGEVLAMATYPSYDISTYNENAAALNQAAGSPLWNRAARTAYPPGSTFKPAIALAALTEGTIDRRSTVTCRREYTYFPSQTFSCLGYHGSLNVVSALRVSCNIFFYETGRRLTIENIDRHAANLGLGQRTGIEIEETAGTLPTPVEGEVWNPGYTVQTAIGQYTNAYTPLQLAVYAAALANGGVRYEAHLVKEVRSYDGREVKLQKEPVPLPGGEYSEENLSIVREGMVQAATMGSTASVFSRLPVEVAAKTGTAQTGKGVANGCLITYAPSQQPEIAIGIVVEEAGSGTATAEIAEEIYRYYFERQAGSTSPQTEVLLP